MDEIRDVDVYFEKQWKNIKSDGQDGKCIAKHLQWKVYI